MALCREWMARMVREMRAVAKLSSGTVQWWTNDQTFFNEVVHKAPSPRGFALKAAQAVERGSAERLLRAGATTPERRQLLEAALARLEGARRTNATAALEAMRGLVFKRLPCADGCFGTGVATQACTALQPTCQPPW